jgi:hypothetical protein
MPKRTHVNRHDTYAPRGRRPQPHAPRRTSSWWQDAPRDGFLERATKETVIAQSEKPPSLVMGWPSATEWEPV